MTNEEKHRALREECQKHDGTCGGCLLKDDFMCKSWIDGCIYNPNDYDDIEFAYHTLQERKTKPKGQEAKADKGKPRVSLVPMQIVKDIAVIREYGVNKYKTVDNWKNVEVERYIDALGRHTLEFLNNPLGVDEESGYPHLWHIGCNVAFLSELMKGEFK